MSRILTHAWTLAILLGPLAVGLARPLAAQGTLYNSGAACCGLDGYRLGSSASGPTLAGNFALGSDATLTGATFDVFAWDPVPTAPTGIAWTLFTNSPANLPGTPLSSGTTAFGGQNAGFAATWSVSFPAVPVQGGQRYWLAIAQLGGSPFSWRTTPFSTDTTPSALGGPTTWQYLPLDPNASFGELTNQLAFTVIGTTAPEPSSIALLSTGLLGMVPILRRRR